MAKESNKTLKAFANLRPNGNWAVIKEEYLEGTLVKLNTQMAKERDEVELRILQGKAQMIQAILDLSENSAEILHTRGAS